MPAVDTNVVVRLLIEDDPAQVARVRALFVTQDVFVSLTVMLESEWVLRRVYKLNKTEIIAGLRRIAGLTTVAVEQADRFANVLDFAEAGMDFADALHISGIPDGTTFVTFDRDLIRHAAQHGQSVAEP